MRKLLKDIPELKKGIFHWNVLGHTYKITNNVEALIKEWYYYAEDFQASDFLDNLLPLGFSQKGFFLCGSTKKKKVPKKWRVFLLKTIFVYACQSCLHMLANKQRLLAQEQKVIKLVLALFGKMVRPWGEKAAS